MKYITSKKEEKGRCVFCEKLNKNPENDRETYLVYRGETTFATLNIYPYNTGHLMVLPKAHIATLADASFKLQAEMMALTSYFTDLLSQLMHPDGFNIGINIGQAAGAGIDSHLHIHIVPRWNGDSNYMPVVGKTRVLPEELVDTYDKIVALMKKQPPQFPSLNP